MRQWLIGHTIGLSDTKSVGLCCAPLMLLLPLLSALTSADAIIDEPHIRGTYEHMSHHTEYYCMKLYQKVWETNSTTHHLPNQLFLRPIAPSIESQMHYFMNEYKNTQYYHYYYCFNTNTNTITLSLYISKYINSFLINFKFNTFIELRLRSLHALPSLQFNWFPNY
jgi:hypothetical protein